MKVFRGSASTAKVGAKRTSPVLAIAPHAKEKSLEAGNILAPSYELVMSRRYLRREPWPRPRWRTVGRPTLRGPKMAGFMRRLTERRARRRTTRDERRNRRLADPRPRSSTAQARKDLE